MRAISIADVIGPGAAAIGLAAALLAAPPEAFAQYPEKPINVIIQYPAGGTVDTGARVIAPYWEKYLGESLVIINRPGAGGEIAETELAGSEPDGYTIGAWAAPPQNVLIATRDVAFALDDFSWIGNQQADPNLLVVQADSEIETFEDFVKVSEKKEGGLRVATPGRFNDEELVIALMESQIGLPLTLVPFDGSPQALAALLGGHVDAMLENTVSLRPGVEEGKLRPIITFQEQRLESMPDVPTYEEVTGHPLEMASYRGFIGPAAIPEERLSKLRESFEEAMNDPEFKEKAQEAGLPLQYMSGEKWESFVKAMQEDVSKVWSGLQD